MKKQRNKLKGFRTFAGTKSNSAIEPNIFLLICVLCGLVGGKLSVNSSSTEEYGRAIINIEYVPETNIIKEKPPKKPEIPPTIKPNPQIIPEPPSESEVSTPSIPSESRPFTGFHIPNSQPKPSRQSGEGVPKVFIGMVGPDTIGIAEIQPFPKPVPVIPSIIPDSSQKTGPWIPLKMGENVEKWDKEKQVAGREFNDILSFFYNKIEALKAIQETRVSYHGKTKIESRPFTLMIYDYDGLDYRLHIPQKSSDKVHFSVRESKSDPHKTIQINPLLEARKMKSLLQKIDLK
jgi:hypothetical protein